MNRRDRENFTPLLLAASEGKPEAVETLLKHKADVTVTDKSDRSCVFWAAHEVE